MSVNFDHPANRGMLVFLGDPARLQKAVSVTKARPDCAPEEAGDPYYRLGVHPDLLRRLWDELGGSLPADCRRIVYGTPALVHPASGVIFGFCEGTHAYALRLPPTEHEAAIRSGASLIHQYPAIAKLNLPASELDLREIGDEWVFGGWYRDEAAWCLAAFHDAGAGQDPQGADHA